MKQITSLDLVDLAEKYAHHFGISHWRVSFLVRGNGQFFKSLKDGADCRTKTVVHAINWFSSNWPDDLEWPVDVPRPAVKEDAA